MCTVVIRVPHSADEPVRMLAVRDEDPHRAWQPLGPSWPETHPGIVGVRDARAGGAWLAADAAHGRLSVLLNRADVVGLPADALVSRGGLVLASVGGASPTGPQRTHGFNLVEVDGPTAQVVTWDGAELRTIPLSPGTHMIAHDDVDDPTTGRIQRWLAEFSDAPADGDEWWMPWLSVLARSAELPAADDRAIIRDNRPLGYPTLSLLVCAAEITTDAVDVRYAELAEPGEWDAIDLV